MPDRIPLICAPTPIHRLDRASDALEIDLWIKRDDLTGFAGGGNKGRKLEYLMKDVLDSGAHAVVTRGSYQSNFIRQCGAACRLFGIEFHAAAMSWPYPGEDRKTKPPQWRDSGKPTGNALLNVWTGSTVHLFPDDTFDAMEHRAADIAEGLRKEGKQVYHIKGGGSMPLGAYGFVVAVEEIASQCDPFEQIVFASGSGGTQTGLTYGLRLKGLTTRAMGICTDDEPEMIDDFPPLAAGLDELLGNSLNLRSEDFWMTTEFCGGGYQVPSMETDAAIRFLAETEAIFLDPVYTGKAFAGVITMARRGELPGRTLFWHTGGFPCLFAEGREPK
jgi:1-aminocyclopropane-1-carboxylate deaminase/D-cysteine desulfhydrase-like pyridoxal-dependent ACC family enzyme